MTNIILIAAVAENNIIGRDGKIPWKISEDMKHFKELTMPHPVIMGRKTYDSIPKRFRPLPQRKNIVLSKTLSQENGIYIAKTIEKALEFCGNQESYVIGGQQVYEQFIPFAQGLELTRIHANFEGDAFFPKIDWRMWNEVNREDHEEYSFVTYERR
jgi:dihydrofolate reductase